MDIKQVIIVRKDLNLTPGKMAAQVAHASLNAILLRASRINDTLVLKTDEVFDNWIFGDFKKIVLAVKNEKELFKYYNKFIEKGFIATMIKDLAYNELLEPTYTAIGIEPLKASEIDPIVKRLRLY